MRWGWVAMLSMGCLGSPDFFGTGGGSAIGGSGGHAGGVAGAGGGSGGGSVHAGGGVGPAGGGFFGAGGGFAGGAAGARGGGGSPLDIDAGPYMSRSGTVASTATAAAVINPDLTTLTVFPNMAPPVSFDVFPMGSEPSSIAGDVTGRDTVYVTLRKSGTLARVDNLNTHPTMSWSVRVCSEPTGVALAPNGSTAVVACFGEPLAVIVNTQTSAVHPVGLPGVARGVAITNNGDSNDLDERAILPIFYGAPTQEGTDDGRTGLVFELWLQTQTQWNTISIPPIADTGYSATPDGGHVGCAPNQLAAVALIDHWAVVPFTCASPQPPATPTATLFSAAALLDLDNGVEVGTPVVFGPNLGLGRSRMGGLVDVDIWPDTSSVYVLGQGANSVARLAITQTGLVPVPIDGGIDALSGISPCGYPGPPCGGPGGGFDAGSGPLGVPISVYGSVEGFIVNDWTGRSIVGDVQGQRFVIPYGPPVLPGSTDEAVLLGRRLFYTALDRWSSDQVGSCASCHPDGLSDNITWMFSAGPRQTPPLDGTFSKRDPSDHRAQNWTANFDEIYDVEGVVRNVLGGRGALTNAADAPIALNNGVLLEGLTVRNDNLSGSTRAVDVDLSGVHDWSLIEGFIQRVRTNQAPFALDAAAVARGRNVFAAGGCDLCHGGYKWSVSRVPYTPSPAKNGSLPGDNGAPAQAFGLRSELRDGGTWTQVNHDTLKISGEVASNPDGGAPLTIGPERITCVIRDVGTFDAAAALERRPNGSTAQGALGFNVPSLLGLATSAPYFHHGGAATLKDVFSSRYLTHRTAGNPAFTPSSQELDDLAAFLESIDESTPVFPVQRDLCGGY